MENQAKIEVMPKCFGYAADPLCIAKKDFAKASLHDGVVMDEKGEMLKRHLERLQDEEKGGADDD